MAKAGIVTGFSKSTKPRLCSFCDQVLSKQITDVWEYPSRSPTDLQKTAKLGCFICGWVVLLIRQKEVTEELETEAMYIYWHDTESACLSWSLDFKPGRLDHVCGESGPIFCVINESGKSLC